jgi:hypothetical protein
MASPVSSSQRSAVRDQQLELPLNLSVSAGFTVQRIDRHIVLTQKPIETWGSVKDAARRLRRSDRWVRVLCESGCIKARKLPGAKIWDVDMIALEEWIEQGDRSAAADNLRNYRQSRQREE